MKPAKPLPFHLIAKCVNDDIPHGKSPWNWIKKDQLYRITAHAIPLNASEEHCFYIEDQKGNKIVPFDGVYTFLGSRFTIIDQIWLN